MSITIGWWGIPLAITVGSLVWAFSGDYAPRGDYDFGTPLIGLLRLSAAIIVSLIAWLAWAVL